MKNKLLRLLPILICLFLMAGALAVTTSAAESEHKIYYIGSSGVHVNPEYEGSYGGEHVADKDEQANSTEYSSTDYVWSIEAAADVLRQQMINRVNYITVMVALPEYKSGLGTELINMAFEHTGDPKGGDYLERHWNTWSCNGSYYIDGYYYFTLNFNLTYMTTAAQEAVVDVAVDNLLNQLNVYYSDDYTKVKAIYDWLCSNIVYDYANLENDAYMLKYTAYAGLINRTCVCQGYASLFYRLALELDVEARYISGTASGGPHGWNIVKLDGLYYNLDATWDATYKQYGYPYEYFLRCMANFPDHYRGSKTSTDEFNAQHPMDTMDYSQAVAAVASGTFGNGLYWVLNGKGTLTISGNGGMPWYWNASDAPWYSYRSSIKAVVISSGIQSVSSYAFNGYTNIKSVTIGDTVTYIGASTFAGCTSLSEITFKGTAACSLSGTTFANVYATVYYPGLSSEWASVIGNSYGGSLTWKALISANDGWVQSGSDWYFIENGRKHTGWLYQGGYWFYMDGFGIMQTGWTQAGENWYYMNTSGVMQTGWKQVGSYWYYLGSTGAMHTGWQKINGNWFHFAESGSMHTGLQKINGKYYYFASGGAMQTGWHTVNGVRRYFGSDGAAVTDWSRSGGKWYYLKDGAIQKGWVKVGSDWYYMDSTGAMQTGWKSIGKNWYYFAKGGAMQTGWQQINGNWFYFASGGAMQTGWQKIGTNWYYFASGGAMLTGWQQIGANWYYFAKGGVMQTGWVYVNGYWYYFAGGGAMQTGWTQVGSNWYYFASGGAMLTGWQKIGGHWYYMNSKGVMQTGTQVIGGKVYTFNKNGVWVA